jgi:hypothetical protein
MYCNVRKGQNNSKYFIFNNFCFLSLHKVLSLVLPSTFNYAVSNAVSYRISEAGCMAVNDQ